MSLCGLEESRKHSERVCREGDLRSSRAPAHSTRRGRVTRNASSWASHHVNSRWKFALCKWPANGSAAAPPPRLRSAEHDEVSRVALMPRSFSSAHGLRTRKPCGLPPCSRLRAHPGARAAHRCAQHRAVRRQPAQGAHFPSLLAPPCVVRDVERAGPHVVEVDELMRLADHVQDDVHRPPRVGPLQLRADLQRRRGRKFWIFEQNFFYGRVPVPERGSRSFPTLRCWGGLGGWN